MVLEMMCSTASTPEAAKTSNLKKRSSQKSKLSHRTKEMRQCNFEQMASNYVGHVLDVLSSCSILSLSPNLLFDKFDVLVWADWPSI